MSAARVDLNREKGKPKVARPTPRIRVFGERRRSYGRTYFVGSLSLVGGDLARRRWFGIGRTIDEISMVFFFQLLRDRSKRIVDRIRNEIETSWLESDVVWSLEPPRDWVSSRRRSANRSTKRNRARAEVKQIWREIAANRIFSTLRRARRLS